MKVLLGRNSLQEKRKQRMLSHKTRSIFCLNIQGCGGLIILFPLRLSLINQLKNQISHIHGL